MVLWEVKNKTYPIKSTLSLVAGGVVELSASLPAPGAYVVGILYRGVLLYFAFEVAMKK